MRDNGGTLVDIVPRLLSRIEVQGGVKEDNNIELPLRGIFHIFGASPPPFAPYSRICAAPPHTHARTPPPPFPLLVEPLNSPPFRFLRSFSRSSASEQRCTHVRGAPRGAPLEIFLHKTDRTREKSSRVDVSRRPSRHVYFLYEYFRNSIGIKSEGERSRARDVRSRRVFERKWESERYRSAIFLFLRATTA